VAGYAEGLAIVDVSDPANPALAGSYDTPDYAVGVYVSGDYAYVADWHSGLHIIDVSDPANLAPAGSYDALTDTFGVFISGGYVYVVDRVCFFSVLKSGLPME